jgi:hypothetical protein
MKTSSVVSIVASALVVASLCAHLTAQDVYVPYNAVCDDSSSQYDSGACFDYVQSIRPVKPATNCGHNAPAANIWMYTGDQTSVMNITSAWTEGGNGEGYATVCE